MNRSTTSAGPGSKLRGLFVSDITRDIPPVVYFHEQSPDKLAAEVSEYIITGGFEPDSPNHRRVPQGIHEEYVRLLKAIAADLGKTDLPAVWVSGFYGSGKSSFAKLLGLSLDGDVRLPGGRLLSDAWIARDTSKRRGELVEAWTTLRSRLSKPLAVVFDVGGTARDREHVHAVCVRQLQAKLGYCSVEPLVAEFELRLERAGEWDRFLSTAHAQLGRPWAEVAQQPFAEEEFSAVMATMFPDRYRDPMAWFASRGGTQASAGSPEDAVAAIRDMLAYRRPGADLFFVIDEVSQYIHSSQDRVDRLRAFVTALGSATRGKIWLIAIGQQKLDEGAGDSFLLWAKDRFPPQFRVHLATTNIRDVVHKRLLQKTPAAAEQLRELYARHRPDLQLYCYQGSEILKDDFVDVYPLLPDYIDLIMQITTAMRVRSRRMQGDDQAIRGLLQVLGELFRGQGFAEREIGELVTLDLIYDIQHTSLDSDVQNSMARILNRCANEAKSVTLIRVAKVVALLELIQDVIPTDAKFVAQCLFGRLGQGNNLAEITEALETLHKWKLLGYGEKQGYCIQSSAGEEWESERDDFEPPSDDISALVQDTLKFLLGKIDPPRLEGRPFPWAANFSDERRADDLSLLDPRDHAAFRVDFRLRPNDLDPDAPATEREQIVLAEQAAWIRRSSETALCQRLVWVVDALTPISELARELLRSQAMVRKYKPRVSSLAAARQRLFFEEESRVEDLVLKLRATVAEAWLAGAMYYRGRRIEPREHGKEFGPALAAVASRILPELYPHFIALTILPGEFEQLLQPEPSGISPKFLAEGLGIFEVEHKRFLPACHGVVPQRIEAFLRNEPNPPSGAVLLGHFGGPPFGYTVDVVKACIAGLLRAGRLRIQPEGGGEVTAIRDVGTRDLFEKDRPFKRATISLAGDDEIGFQSRARICKFFEDKLFPSRGRVMEREDHAIADAVAETFPRLAQKTRVLLDRLRRLPTSAIDGMPSKPKLDDELLKFEEALEQALRSSRQTKPTVRIVKQHLHTLQAGIARLEKLEHELTDDGVAELLRAYDAVSHQLAQLRALHERRPLAEVAEIEANARTLAELLRGDRPWEFMDTLRPAVASLRKRYIVERQLLLEWQAQRVELVREAIIRREGFARLDAQQTHEVLRPLAAALDDTPEDAIAPALLALADSFLIRLDEKSTEANKILDSLLSHGRSSPVRPLDLRLRDRELATEADVDALLEEIRQRLLDQIHAGVRIRLT